ncbi:MAG: diaminopimelate epimerase [Bdellovibrionaceae bacterium]|nr:diaminopimelate epimerase [Pseudobdellovibrionaceae bacterium]|tara:strand:- start:4240 stop:5025 length:786 start_codon:yes stop_codon:yes gene_type:complete
MSSFSFVKLHGLGNDFVLVDERNLSRSWDQELIQKVLHRRLGIGADQLIFLRSSKNSDIQVLFFNSDGSQSGMCGNGLRAVGEFLFVKEKKKQVSVELLDRVCQVQRMNDLWSVDMGGVHIVDKRGQVRVEAGTFDFTEVEIGNPHAVVFSGSPIDSEPLHLWGPQIENHIRFSQGVNVELGFLKNRKELDLRVWERGAGLTLACGSGACAAMAAYRIHDQVDENVQIHLPGGRVEVHWEGPGKSMTLKGPAQWVFEGVWR